LLTPLRAWVKCQYVSFDGILGLALYTVFIGGLLLIVAAIALCLLKCAFRGFRDPDYHATRDLKAKPGEIDTDQYAVTQILRFVAGLMNDSSGCTADCSVAGKLSIVFPINCRYWI
jgi:hypothetical protein